MSYRGHGRRGNPHNNRERSYANDNRADRELLNFEIYIDLQSTESFINLSIYLLLRCRRTSVFHLNGLNALQKK